MKNGSRKTKPKNLDWVNPETVPTRVWLNPTLDTYFKAFSEQAIIMELKKIIKIGRNPLDRKRLKKEDIAEIRQMIQDLG
jgi:hypothetical protein